MREIHLNLSDDKQLENIGDSLSSSTRRKILQMLSRHSYSVYQIAKELDLSMSTTSFHLKILREAKLIKEISNPSKKGNEKNISLACESAIVLFGIDHRGGLNETTLQIPLGCFIDYDITPPCCICTPEQFIRPMDDPVIFKDPLRIQAQLISFFKGTITFPLPLDSLKAENISSITIFMELCSECPDYNNSWKSNITFWLNDEEVATYLSLGDYGDRRGILTPSWWPDNSTQYGLPVALKIDKSGSYLNGQKVSEVSLKDVHLEKSTIARFRLGVKDNAKYVGGVNIFGRCFGDINDDIKVQISYFSESAKPNQ